MRVRREGRGSPRHFEAWRAVQHAAAGIVRGSAWCGGVRACVQEAMSARVCARAGVAWLVQAVCAWQVAWVRAWRGGRSFSPLLMGGGWNPRGHGMLLQGQTHVCTQAGRREEVGR